MHSLLMIVGEGAPAPLALSALLGLWDTVWPYLLMVLGFSLIVFVHELGHFAVAKWAGVRVERFAVGFGRELFGFSRGETRYSFNLLPLGGYVKMLGQEDFDDKTEELRFKDDPRSFVNKPVGHRMAIVSAGVIMNVIFACLLFMIVFLVGMQAVGTRIGFVEPDSPADKAGLQPGDNILRINGDRIHEFRDVSMKVQLASPHEPIEFVVARQGETLKPVYVRPDYRRPENTREPRRQIIGILPGVTREILWVGPEIDSSQPDQPRIGDAIVEVDGVPVNEDNVNLLLTTLVHAKEVYVERKDPKDPKAAPQRLKVNIPPQLGLFPADTRDPDSVSILGLTPLMRFGAVHPQGRAALAGIDVGDTVLHFDDIPQPRKADISRAIADNADSDVYFEVLKSGGKVRRGFVRPKPNRTGPATIQAEFEAVATDDDAGSAAGRRARVVSVRRYGRAEKAGLEVGDIVQSFSGKSYPTPSEITRVVRNSAEKGLPIEVRKADGRVLRTVVHPQVPGAIDANYTLVADDVLRTGRIVEMLNGRPTPAAEAEIPAGAMVLAVDDKPVSSWRELVDRFRSHAGQSVALTYKHAGETHVVDFSVPRSLRTVLGVGPEARILAIDGQRTVLTQTSRGEEEVHVGYHEGTKALLGRLAGQKNVPVLYRPTPVGEPVTAYIDVTEDMVDPWLGRVAYAPNVEVGAEIILLKGETALDAVRIGLHKTWYFVLMVYETMNRMIFSQSVGVENLSGPLGILSAGGQIARLGFVEFLFFMAIISANLAVINFLPLPIVDGGLMVFLIIEKIKGSPVSIRVQVATQVIGLFLIIGAFLFVTYNDVLRIWG